MEIPVLISDSFRTSGLHHEALQAAEIVLKQAKVIVAFLINHSILKLNQRLFEYILIPMDFFRGSLKSNTSGLPKPPSTGCQG